MDMEKTTIIVNGKNSVSKIEAYLGSIATSLETLIDLYNLVLPQILPSLRDEEDEEEEEDEVEEKKECCCDKKAESKEETSSLEDELKGILSKLYKLL